MKWKRSKASKYYSESGNYRIAACRVKDVILYTPHHNAEILGPATQDGSKAKATAEKHNNLRDKL